MNHTKEPWNTWKNLYPRVITSEFESEDIARATYEEDALRIVACVNACAGITNEALEKGIILDSVKLHEAILDQQPSSFFKEYGVKVWEDV